MAEIDDIELPARPPLTITVAGETIKMSYGLEMDLRRLLPDPSSALKLISDDPFTQDYVIRRVMTPSKKIITNQDDLKPAEEIELDSDEVEEVLKWATEHALYFFVKRTVGVGQLGVRYAKALPMRSSDGSETSASKTPSAGPSDA